MHDQAFEISTPVISPIISLAISRDIGPSKYLFVERKVYPPRMRVSVNGILWDAKVFIMSET